MSESFMDGFMFALLIVSVFVLGMAAGGSLEQHLAKAPTQCALPQK